MVELVRSSVGDPAPVNLAAGRPPAAATGPGTGRRASPLAIAAIVAVVVVMGSGVAYEVVTAPSPTGTCASFTARQLGADPTPGTVSGNATPNYLGATTSNGAVREVPAGQIIKVVAAENFWGNLVGQLGGNLTSVLSVVSDPNTDPHEYEANTSDAAAIADANLVVVNGVGYDDWALELVASSGTTGQELLNVGTLTGVSVSGGIVTGNPHQWYNPLYVNDTLRAMFSDLVALQPSSRAVFEQNFALLNTSGGGSSGGVSLDQLYSRATEIRDEFQGTVVASTESIFVYLANYTGLDLLSPPAFMEAISEGNDPPAASVALFECQIESGHVKVLVYNIQTVTPIATAVEAMAASHGVATTSVSETIQPPDTTFQAWMYGEYNALENALNADRLGQ